MGTTSNLDFVTLKYNPSGFSFAGIAAQKQGTDNERINVRKIYPNPAHNFFTLQLPSGNNFDITITDILGNQIFKQKNIKAQSKINCSNFPKGTYFLKAINTTATFTEKFVKQ